MAGASRSGSPATCSSVCSGLQPLLDIVLHDCRLFFAFRTAPSHFASPDTVLYVISTDDPAQKSWTFERRFYLGTDLREPRFLSWNGRLFLYFAVLGNARELVAREAERVQGRG